MQLFNYIQYPLYQLLGALALNSVLLLLLRPSSGDTIWSIAGICYALFIVANSLFVFTLVNVWSYFFISLLFSVLYLIIAPYVTSAYQSIRNSHGSNESSMVFLIVIYHPFALLAMILLKKFLQ